MRNERKAIREVAKKHGITEIEVVANIEEAIAAAKIAGITETELQQMLEMLLRVEI